jgi:hypothetical protein
VRIAHRPLLLKQKILNVLTLSGNFKRFTKLSILCSHSAAGFTGKLHCRQFLLAHMSGADIACAAIRAVNFFNSWIAQMARIIRHCTATFTGMGHNETPY